jgi:hypothetical protein
LPHPILTNKAIIEIRTVILLIIKDSIINMS